MDVKTGVNDDMEESGSNATTPVAGGSGSVSSNNKAKTRKPASAQVKKLEAELEAVQAERDELKDLLLRKAAEFDNYKKRTQAENLQLIAQANGDLLADLLPVFDDIERSVLSARENEDFKVLLDGVELVFKSFAKVLERRGLKPIQAVGKLFDPEKHDALMQVESDEHESGVVLDEHKKGYMLNDRVLRHSQVLVSK